MKKIYVFLLGMLTSTSMFAWTWTGEAPSNGDYYIYNVNQNKWLWDTQTYPNNSYSGEALSTDSLIWTFNGDANSTFTLTSTNGNQFSQKDKNWGTRIETGVNGISEAKRINLQTALQGQNYSLYFEQKFLNRGRNIKSTSATRIETTNDASYEWRYVSLAEMDVYKNRALTFSATVGNAVGVVGGAPVASVSVASYELQNYAESTETKSVATFTANPAENYNFEGWYSDADFTDKVSAEETYTINFSYAKQSATLYAKYAQGAVATLITQKVTTLDYFTTYSFDELFDSNNTNPFIVTCEGETISSLTTHKEATITLFVSQAEVENEFLAATSVEFTFTTAPVAAYNAIILDEYIFESNETSGNVEAATTYDLFWDNTANNAGIASYEYKTSFAASRSFKVYQQIAGVWVLIGNKGNSGDWRALSDDVLNPAATGIRFEYAGTGLGSAQVRNVKISRRTNNYFESLAEIDTTKANVTSIALTLPVFYGNVHTVLYELTDIAATNGATAIVTMVPEVEPANGEGDFGTYNFTINASADKVFTTITANAHFFNAEGTDIVVPVTINFGAQVTETREELLGEGTHKYGTICLPLDVTAEEVSAKAEEVVFFSVSSVANDVVIIDEVESLEAGYAYVYRANVESFTINTILGEPTLVAAAQTYMVGNLSDEAVDAPVNSYILSENELHKVEAAGVATVAKNRAYFTLDIATTQARLAERSGIATNIEKVQTLDINKFILDGKVLIRRNGKFFDLNGKLVK